MGSTIPLKSAVVVITGASSGLGRATARRFAGKGAHLVLAARRGEALDELADELRELGVRAIAVPTDVTDEGAVDELARRAVAELGRIDVWVNNAGVYMMGLFDEVPTEAHRRLLETNLFGTMYGAKAAITQFRRQGRGVLVNVCSLAGKTGYRYGASYCASKFAVRGLGECLRQDLLGTGIHVATVFPATIDTPLFDHAANFTGRRLVAMNPVYAVDRVARAVVSAARQPRREVVVGGMPRLSAILNVVAPGLFERVYARMVDRKHFSDTPAVRTAGNLFAPMGSTEETGGWRRLAPRVALGALAATALGALAWKAAPRLRAV